MTREKWLPVVLIVNRASRIRAMVDIREPRGHQEQLYSRENETPAERIDRNWNEMLQELRVVQTGVQILAGFLLTLPFQQRFLTLTGAQRAMFLAAISLATASTGLLVAPVSSHRLLSRKHEKDVLVGTSNVLVKSGLTALGLTMGTVILLAFSLVTSTAAAVLAAAAALSFFFAVWVVIPLTLLRRDRARRGPEGELKRRPDWNDQGERREPPHLR